MDHNDLPVNEAGNGAANENPAAAAADPAADGAAAANTEAAPASAEPRTYTQADLDRIVTARIQRERNKYKDYDDIKAELQTLKGQSAIRDMRDRVAGETQVPAHLLTGDTEELCRQQAEAILSFAQTRSTAPAVPDGGEVHSHGGGSTRDQFADWFTDALGTT